MPGPSFTQNGFRFRNDDGSETTATWIGLANVNASLTPDIVYRIRLAIQNTGGTGSFAPTLEYSHNGGSYAAVNGSSPVIRASPSAVVSDGTATTRQISSGGFVANVIDTSDGSGSTISLTGTYFTEVEFCFTVRSADVAANDTISLRVYNSGSSITWAQTPTITVYIPANLIEDHFRFRNDDGNETSATWVAATDATATLTANKTYRIRLSVSNGGGAATVGAQLQYTRDGTNFANVTGSSPVVRAHSSAYVSDGTATTQQITSGPFVAGAVDTIDGASPNVSLPGGDSIEFEFCFQVSAAGLTNGEGVGFRVLQNYGGTAGGVIAYVATAVAFVHVPVGPATLWQNDGALLFGKGGAMFCADSPCPHICPPGPSPSITVPSPRVGPPCVTCTDGIAPDAFYVKITKPVSWAGTYYVPLDHNSTQPNLPSYVLSLSPYNPEITVTLSCDVILFQGRITVALAGLGGSTYASTFGLAPYDCKGIHVHDTAGGTEDNPLWDYEWWAAT